MKAHSASLINAAFLITLSLWGYWSSDSPSTTALIPTFTGVFLVLLNKGIKNENKMIAHIAVLLTLLMSIGLIKPLTAAFGREDNAAILRVLFMLISTIFAFIFLILMSLGIALTRLKVFSFKKSFISSLARVFIGPAIGFAIIHYYNLTGFAAGVLLIQCSMPSAVLNFLVGSLYSPKETVDDVASMIFVSTVLSFITVPIIVFIALKYFI